MALDLSELTPAPWASVCRDESCEDFDDRRFVIVQRGPQWVVAWGHRLEADADFIALARNAFDVMMRRGWGVHRCGDGWNVSGILGLLPEQREFVDWCLGNDRAWPDPFSALVEADRWYKENVEKKNANQEKEQAM